MAFPPIILRSLRPEVPLAVSVWADEHRVLNSRSAAEAGRYRTSRTPYLRQIMDDLSVTSPVQTVILKKGSQVGASEAGNNWIGYAIDQAPGPMMLVQPTVELAKRFSKQRIDTLIEASDRLRARVAAAKSRDSGNTMLLKEFTGGILVITGANSAAGLRAMPVRYLFMDEVDAYPRDVENEGDPMRLADARTRTFSFRAKRFIPSTPTIKGMSRITRLYERSDQRRYFVPCPSCGEKQPLEFAQLRWQPGRPETVNYHCVACDGAIGEHHKTAMLEGGEWRATVETNDPTTRGYHLSALYSPIGWLSWADIASQWEEAIGDVDARKTFTNTILGEAWEEEADVVPDWERLYERREEWEYNTVPEEGLFLTAGADVQNDRVEVDVWAWGRGLRSWLVEHIVCWGDPTTETPWVEMTALLARSWPHAKGERLSLQRLAIDTGAFTQSVYQWARRHPRGTVIPIKGMSAYDRLVPVSGPTRGEVLQNGARMRGGLSLWTVSVSFFKREFYKQLTLTRPTDEARERGETDPPGFVHLPRTVTDEWCRQLVSEHMVIVRQRHGFAARTEWRQLRPRNEALDMRVYARAVAWLAGADRWPERIWRDLEDQAGVDHPAPAPPSPVVEAAPAAAGQLGRRPSPPRRRFNPGAV
jgi:phage terminase large subunit GpA-like protein